VCLLIFCFIIFSFSLMVLLGYKALSSVYQKVKTISQQHV
jgi:hypothetical protein